jgi:hypothetical protein
MLSERNSSLTCLWKNVSRVPDLRDSIRTVTAHAGSCW